MKTYWDTSAIIYCFHEDDKLDLLLDGDKADRITRAHTLAEMFATLTGRFSPQYAPNDAEKVIRGLAKIFTFVTISHADTLGAMSKAQLLNVHGGRIHDLLHVTAACKAKADQIFTLNTKHFNGLTDRMPILEPA